MSAPPAPLFIDPVHLAATDPTLIEGPDGRWWMLYTQRRAGDTGPGVTWVHGTDIGAAVSDDGGISWRYQGVVEGIDPDAGRNTLWAPEVVFADGLFHMFVSHVVGVPSRWSGHARRILHHVSGDLRHWQFAGSLPLSSDRVIDAAVHPLPRGGFRLWYKDEANGSATWAADSPDLSIWGPSRPVITEPGHEGPNVFHLAGWFWLLVDEWRGLAVYRSDDLDRWHRQGLILDRPGRRPWDHTIGRHADVVVGRDADDDEVGWIFYFTHRVDRDDEHAPRLEDAAAAIAEHRTDIQVAQLEVTEGRLICDRDAPVDLDLRRASRYIGSPPSR